MINDALSCAPDENLKPSFLLPLRSGPGSSLHYMTGLLNPSILSVSYGLDEIQIALGGGDPDAEAAALEALALEGVTVFVSAGDQGAYGRTGLENSPATLNAPTISRGGSLERLGTRGWRNRWRSKQPSGQILRSASFRVQTWLNSTAEMVTRAMYRTWLR
jgi:hypothetical protein